VNSCFVAFFLRPGRASISRGCDRKIGPELGPLKFRKETNALEEPGLKKEVNSQGYATHPCMAAAWHGYFSPKSGDSGATNAKATGKC